MLNLYSKFFLFSIFLHVAIAFIFYTALGFPSAIRANKEISVEVREIRGFKNRTANTPKIDGSTSSGTASKNNTLIEGEGNNSPLGAAREEKIHPEYPLLSKKLGEEGECVFNLELAKNGRVIKANLERSSGFFRLDEAARIALEKASFPNENTTKKFTVVFRLQDK